MPGRTIIPQQLAKPNGLADWCKWLGWLCFVACWLVAAAACPVLLAACPICSLPACGVPTSCGGCTSGMFSCRLAFVLVHCLWVVFSSIPHLSFETVCLICLSGSSVYGMTAVGSGHCLVSADFDSVDLVPFVLVSAC